MCMDTYKFPHLKFVGTLKIKIPKFLPELKSKCEHRKHSSTLFLRPKFDVGRSMHRHSRSSMGI